MPDRKKVIQAIEWCQENTCEGCPYDTHNNESCRISDDILALLKEQEPKEVKYKSTRIDFLEEYFEGECPSCRSFIDENSNRNFCGYCGQAVKWE